MTILGNQNNDAEDNELLASSRMEQPGGFTARSHRQRRDSVGGNKMDQTCIDTDDDDLEFDDANHEENEDIVKHELSAFMVS